MSGRTRLLFSTLAILAVALIVWLPTIDWGLPSRDADKYLFGDRRPWTGAEIVALTATTQPTNAMRGADVDADPILDRSKPVILNDTDAKRAAIVRRYRLMSGQPDEFIQFKALGEMAARSGLARLDPRLYQYGGLWMYPVGALVRTAMLVGYIEGPPPGTPAIEFYLDHPEAFGKFYVVARFYSWCWGLVAAFAIAWIARRVTDSIGLATLAAVAFMLLPVTRTATHEAKPHLAGAALCLCAVIAATRYVETGKSRWLIGAGAFCGAAMAMVVSMLLSCAVLPTMVWLRWRATKHPTKPIAVRSDPETLNVLGNPAAERSAWSGRFRALVAPVATSLAIAAFVYVATNPFVVINAITHPEILRSNLGNSTAMYSPRSDGIHAVRDAIRIACVAMTSICFWTSTTCAVGSLIFLIFRADKPSAIALTFVLPTSLILLQFVVLSNGKPAEYARFGLFLAAIFSVCFTYFLRQLNVSIHQGYLLSLMLVVVCGGSLFISQFHLDEHRARLVTTRIVNRTLTDFRERELLNVSVATLYEPAPWSAPATDLFRSDIWLASRDVQFRQFDLIVWPTNLATQVRRRDDVAEAVDWFDNNYETEWHPLNSDSRPAVYPPAE